MILRTRLIRQWDTAGQSCGPLSRSRLTIRPGTFPNHHDRLLPRSNGYLDCLRRYGRKVIQQYVHRRPIHTVTDMPDIKTWHSQIDQHASTGVNKILIGNKCDWDEKRVVSVEQGRELADEFGLRFLETSAKANEGVEEAFFTLARCVDPFDCTIYADILQRYQDPSN